MLNMNFSQTVQLNTQLQSWVASPRAGVWRKPLAREETERGHATSIVRYDPGASFHSHNHPGGEEILVLEGTFSDETGDFGVGAYFRNPAGFVHAPFSEDGCVIFVKLHQFQLGDVARLSIQTDAEEFHSLAPGISILPLHQYETERVSMLRLAEGSVLDLDKFTGVEWYLVSGEVLVNGDCRLASGAWCRAQDQRVIEAAADSTLWLKTGHF